MDVKRAPRILCEMPIKVPMDNRHDSNVVWNWLVENMGPHRQHLEVDDWRWWTSRRDLVDDDYRRVYCFRYPKDAMLFKLTWG